MLTNALLSGNQHPYQIVCDHIRAPTCTCCVQGPAQRNVAASRKLAVGGRAPYDFLPTANAEANETWPATVYEQ